MLWGFVRLDKWLDKYRMGAAGLLFGAAESRDWGLSKVR